MHFTILACSQWDSAKEPWDLKSDALPTELTGLRCKLHYLNEHYVYMYFLYQCIHWFKFENDEAERIVSCKCTVLCYILEHSYIVQIHVVKRRTSHMFAFMCKRSYILPDLVFACWKQIQDLCVPFIQYSYIPILHKTLQYTLNFIILELIPMYTLNKSSK